jgi:hypothetical protein
MHLIDGAIIVALIALVAHFLTSRRDGTSVTRRADDSARRWRTPRSTPQSDQQDASDSRDLPERKSIRRERDVDNPHGDDLRALGDKRRIIELMDTGDLAGAEAEVRRLLNRGEGAVQEWCEVRLEVIHRLIKQKG